MRILFGIHQFFPFRYTGTERVTLNLAKQLQRMGHSVSVLTYGIGDQSDEYQPFTEAVSRRDYVFDGVPVTALRHVSVPADPGFGMEDPAIAEACRELLAREPFDVVHVTHPLNLPALATTAASMKIPVVLTLTDYWLVCPRINLFTAAGKTCLGPSEYRYCIEEGCLDEAVDEPLAERRRATDALASAADVLVSPSEFVSSIFRGCKVPKPVRVIRHGMDYSVIRKHVKRREPGSPIVFGFLGHIDPLKGIHTLLEAWTGVGADNIELHIYGEAFHHEDYVRQIKATASADERVSFRGAYEFEDIADVLAEVDVVVLPSIWFETFSLVVALALASGVPVVAINVAGPAELVEHYHGGLTFTPGDSAGLRQIISRIADDPDLLDRLRDSIEEPPRIEEEALEYEMVYSELTGGTR